MCNNTVIISRYLQNPRSQEISHCTCNVSNYLPLKVWILGKEFLVGEIPDKPGVVSMLMSANVVMIIWSEQQLLHMEVCW